ncbi:MAG: N-acetylmuramoyl-L-alanine amidase [Hyphomicrobiaceae bacterium]
MKMPGDVGEAGRNRVTGQRPKAFDQVRMDLAVALIPLMLIPLIMSSSATTAADDPPSKILSREAWGAKPAMTERMKRHSPREIVIHMTGVRMQPSVTLQRKMAGLQSFSQRAAKIGKRTRAPWGDVPYHFYISSDGQMAKGRDVGYAGDTNTNYDTAGRIQIAVEGDFTTEMPKPQQLNSLRKLVAWLARLHKVPPSAITGHNAHAATSCPGKNLEAYLPMLRQAVGSP